MMAGPSSPRPVWCGSLSKPPKNPRPRGRYSVTHLKQTLSAVRFVLTVGFAVFLGSTAFAQDPIDAASNPIKHVVMIIKENRSYDQYFGKFPGADGATTGVTSTGAIVTMGQTPDQMPYDLGHGWGDTHTAMDKGKMDKFDLVGNGNVGGVLMGYTQMDQTTIPNYWSYAQHFALGDAMFSSLAGGSFGNHIY